MRWKLLKLLKEKIIVGDHYHNNPYNTWRPRQHWNHSCPIMLEGKLVKHTFRSFNICKNRPGKWFLILMVVRLFYCWTESHFPFLDSWDFFFFFFSLLIHYSPWIFWNKFNFILNAIYVTENTNRIKPTSPFKNIFLLFFTFFFPTKRKGVHTSGALYTAIPLYNPWHVLSSSTGRKPHWVWTVVEQSKQKTMAL